MRWLSQLFTRTGSRRMGVTAPPESATLMSRTEKIELEAILEERFAAFFAAQGGRAFLDPGWAVCLSAAHGPKITRDPADVGELARVEFQDLLSIRSLLTTELPHIAVARSMLPNLATEATHALALQINRAAAGSAGAPEGFTTLQSEQVRRDD